MERNTHKLTAKMAELIFLEKREEITNPWRLNGRTNSQKLHSMSNIENTSSKFIFMESNNRKIDAIISVKPKRSKEKSCITL